MNNKSTIKEENRLLKNKQIAETRRNTIARRKEMNIRCYDIKLVKNKMSRHQRNFLKNMFKEGKQYRNTCLSKGLQTSNTILLKDGTELPILYLPSQIKQAIFQQLVQDAKNLNKKKTKGGKIGKLKFISELKSINLKQYGNTYVFKDGKLKIQGIKNLFHVRGLEQIDFHGEIANAKLLKLADGYHIIVTNYLPKKEQSIEGSIGIDSGIKNTLTLSNGQQIKFEQIEEIDKKYHVAVSKSNKGSSKIRKAKLRLRKQNLRRMRKQKDRENKLKNKFKHYEIILEDINYQDWFQRFGKEMLNVRLSFLKDLRNIKYIDKYYPSSKTCSYCGYVKGDLKLSERIYHCNSCGEKIDRDWNASINILRKGESLYPPVVQLIDFDGVPYIRTLENRG